MSRDKEHALKTWPSQFDAVWNDMKTHEWRRNDRDFLVGDELELLEYEPHTKTLTGRRILATVTWITEGFGVPPGWCCMSICVAYRLEEGE